LDHIEPLLPTISSTTFVRDELISEDITSGEFTFASVGATSFDYYWNGVFKANLKTNGTSGVAPAWTGNMAVPGAAVGWLTVLAVDGAGNHSPVSAEFYLKKAVGGKLAQYLFNDPAPIPPADPVAADTATELVTAAEEPHYAFDLDATGVGSGAGRFADSNCWSSEIGWTCPDAQDLSLSFSGAGEEAFTQDRPVLSENSFTIGAWVMLTEGSVPRTVIAQDFLEAPTNPDAATAAFDIGYDSVSKRFVFHVNYIGSDGITVTTLTASDALPAEEENGFKRVGKWVYLAAICERPVPGSAVPGRIRLDAAHEDITTADPFGGVAFQVVNGVPITLTAGVPAGKGAFRVGDGAVEKYSWAGMVDNLSVWQQALKDGAADNDVHINANQRNP
jgi:hypothetical protein